MISCDDTGSDKEFIIWVQSDATIRIANYEGGTNHLNLITTSLYRDPTAWQHLVFQADTDTVSNTNSIKLWINGVKVTAFSTETYPAVDYEFALGNSFDHEIGRYALSNNNLWNGYIAEMIFLDGSSNPASDFGGWDASGNWLPVDPTSVVSSGKGTNGFWLDFADSSAPGNDVSGNNNDFSANGTIATTQTNTDSPTNTAADNEGNHPTWNINHSSIDDASSVIDSVTEGNLTATVTSNNTSTIFSTMASPASGKYMIRFVNKDASNNSNILVGLQDTSQAMPAYNSSAGIASSGQRGVVYRFSGGYLYINGTNSHQYTTGASLHDTLDLAWDAATGEVWIAVNGTWQDGEGNTGGGSTDIDGAGTGNVATLTSGYQYAIAVSMWDTTSVFIDQDGGTLPTDFKRFNTANFPSPTVTDPRKYWSNMLYTGSNGNRTVRQCFDSTGTAWTPDFAWVKSRSNATNFTLADSVRGSTKLLFTSATSAETTASDAITAFSEGGLTLGADSGSYVNTSAYTYVAYCMKAGGAASSNSNGNIPSSVSVADHGGFSIVKYDPGGSGSPGDTVGHGLSRAPNFIILKVLEAVGDQNWSVGSDDIAWTNNIFLNLDLAASAGSGPWNNTAPTSSVFSIGSDRDNDAAYIAYCFAKTPGLIACGTYTGNGSSDGPMVIVNDGASGFRPAWLMIKSTASGNWNIVDAARDPFNQISDGLRANSNIAEFSGQAMDFIANGFKLRLSGADYNTSGQSYIYLAFADEPFNLARAR